MPPGRKPKIAPKRITVTDFSATDERRELVSQFAPECVGPNAVFSAFFDDPAIPAEYYARRGYEAVTTPKGEQVNHKGDRLWKRPRDVVAREKAASAQRGLGLASAAKTAGDEAYADGKLQEIKD